MSIPSSRAIHDFVYRQTEIFNDKTRKDEFMALYRTMAPGGYRLEWPAGGTVLEGWEHLERMYDEGITTQSRLVSALISNGEAATYFTHIAEVGGRMFELESIETFRFSGDGSLYCRFWPATPDL